MNVFRLLPLSLSVLAAAVCAQQPDRAAELQRAAAAREQERASIAQARQAIAQHQKQQEQGCWQRFAVEDCLRQARQSARDADLPLRQRELELKRQERQEKAGARMRDIADKQQAKQQPGAVVVHPRDGGESQSLEQRTQQARERAREQEQRLQHSESAAMQRQADKERERAQALKNLQAKQALMQERRLRQAQEQQKRHGAPLPIPVIPAAVPAP